MEHVAFSTAKQRETNIGKLQCSGVFHASGSLFLCVEALEEGPLGAAEAEEDRGPLARRRLPLEVLLLGAGALEVLLPPRLRSTEELGRPLLGVFVLGRPSFFFFFFLGGGRSKGKAVVVGSWLLSGGEREAKMKPKSISWGPTATPMCFGVEVPSDIPTPPRIGG